MYYYSYKRLPMIVSNSPEIFQKKTKSLFKGFGFVFTYMDKLFILTNGDWVDTV